MRPITEGSGVENRSEHYFVKRSVDSLSAHAFHLGQKNMAVNRAEELRL